MITRKNDEAVSPVIGVILMVAITVILAAVIAAFVFGMSGNINKTKVVAVTVQKINSNSITVMYQGGQDANSFSSANVTTIPAATGASPAYPSVATMGLIGPTVGCSTVMSNSAGAYVGRTEVTAVGFFKDGSSQVLLDTFV